MTRRLRYGALAVGAACAFLGITACSGVPTSSSPEVIGPAAGGPAAQPQSVPSPKENADPRRIVSDFLSANVGEPNDPRGARLFLTRTEQSKWSDSSVTILQQAPEVRLANSPAGGKVSVTGKQVGRLAADGTYTPDPAAAGGGGQPVSLEFGLQQVRRQWRINELPDGLVVSAADFAHFYHESKLYFYDVSEQRLVPDPRYTALSGFQALASWELRQLMLGPRGQLQGAVKTELPQQSLTARASVTVAPGPFVSVEMPGSSQLDSATKIQLAAQLTATLGQTQTGTLMSITDGGKLVDIPKLPDRFSRDDVSAATGLFGSADSPLFYIDSHGRLVDQVLDDTPPPGYVPKVVSGPLGTGRYRLTSVAVAARNSANYEVAATTGIGESQKLWVGTLNGGLRRVDLRPGAFTRPSWAPGLREAWVGVGSRLYRFGDSGKPIAVTTALASGRIEALRFSPEGSRLAMIVSGPNGQSQLWVGAVLRSGQSVRIDSPVPITPPSDVLTDVAWNDDTTLYVIGQDVDYRLGALAGPVRRLEHDRASVDRTAAVAGQHHGQRRCAAVRVRGRCRVQAVRGGVGDPERDHHLRDEARLPGVTPSAVTSLTDASVHGRRESVVHRHARYPQLRHGCCGFAPGPAAW